MLQEASRLGYYIKNKDGGEYDNWCWPGKLTFTFLNNNKNQFTEENSVQSNLHNIDLKLVITHC